MIKLKSLGEHRLHSTDIFIFKSSNFSTYAESTDNGPHNELI